MTDPIIWDYFNEFMNEKGFVTQGEAEEYLEAWGNTFEEVYYTMEGAKTMKARQNLSEKIVSKYLFLVCIFYGDRKTCNEEFKSIFSFPEFKSRIGNIINYDDNTLVPSNGKPLKLIDYAIITENFELVDIIYNATQLYSRGKNSPFDFFGKFRRGGFRRKRRTTRKKRNTKKRRKQKEKRNSRKKK